MFCTCISGFKFALNLPAVKSIPVKPFSGAYTAYNERQKAKQKEIDKINAAIEAQYGPNDPGLRGNDGTPGFGKTAAGNYTNQFDGGDPGQGNTTGGYATDDTASFFAKGGRAGYFFGGRVSFKNGGLASIL